MDITSFYPVLMVDDVSAAARFYREELGFEVTFEADWYVSLRFDGGELAILDRAHETIPEGFREPVRGLLLNVEVPDATAEHVRLVGERKLPERLTLRDEDFGQRHFIVEAPGGVLIDVIEPIEPAPEFAAAYA
ncbi:VOC family protein [Microbacterium sp. KSW4-16]|uniref:VOC family protein n=1 Tax=Microbacterium TaxID=33882 RepID=UPI000647CABA|nr:MULTISPECIES: VOC family protein [Microbacterium]MCK8466809.1 VOC family protein [Microbacterium aurugineum]PKQ34137.1 MAG: glyoxalase [Actinobacteria bacterium HGW-Actinobacteria-11]TCJ23262.1 glyoxalase [Microbacterium sp. PI-1]UUE21602.1 VOC family protein [Microbacterium sp. J1-1]